MNRLLMQKHGIWFKKFVEEQDVNWQTEAIRTAFLGWCTVQIVANAFPIQAHSHSTCLLYTSKPLNIKEQEQT